MPKKGLGKGLGALISSSESSQISDNENVILELRLTDIEPNKNQPRKLFDDEKLVELADSIKEHGVLQPVVVKKLENGFYQLIAGERRWRAARKAKLKTIPAIVRNYDDKETMEIAMIENLQRENLNPIEEALGFQELIDTFQLTQDELAKKMGKSRPAVANSLRLLNLPDRIQKMLIDGELSMGHARALLSAENKDLQMAAADRIIQDKLNVRQTETLLKKLQEEEKPERERSATVVKPFILETEKSLSERFGTKVKIQERKGRGKIEIEYYSEQDLERIIQYIKKT